MTGALLVIAPHPDDEILGAGGIMARARAAGDTVAVLVLTDGARSDPGVEPALLAARRQRESEAGLTALLGEVPPLLFLAQPDGALCSAALPLDSAPLLAFLRDVGPVTILVTDPADGHPDHKAAFGFATRLMSAGWGRKLLVMPIGQRVDGLFHAARYDAVPVSPFGVHKAAAIACHTSQIASTTGFALGVEQIAAFNEEEYLRTAYDRDDTCTDAISPDHFDAMFASSPDPWRYDQEPYEQDRFARTVAALSDRHYANGLELGCANGALTARLAPLCDRLIATDASTGALDVAHDRVGHLPGVSLQIASLPQNVPEGPFDLIVASDMLYYLGLDGLVASMARLEHQATSGCRLLIASYLGETETRMTGDMSSEAAIAHLAGWHIVHAERTDRLRIDVLERWPV